MELKDIPLCRDCNVIIERCYFCWEEYKKMRENKEVAQLLLEFKILLKKAPEHCRLHLLKYAIHNTELVLQTRNDRNDCYQCIYPCADCDKLIKII